MRVDFRKGFCLAVALFGLAWSSTLQEVQAGGRVHTVRVISDLDNFRMYFEPQRLLINPGDTVVWVNEEAVDHNVLTYPDGFPAGARGFESPFLAAEGDRWSQTFTTVGIYDYHCLPHLIMGMHGTIIVGNPPYDTPSHTPTSEEVAAYRDKMLEYFTQDDICRPKPTRGPRPSRCAVSADHSSRKPSSRAFLRVIGCSGQVS